MKILFLLLPIFIFAKTIILDDNFNENQILQFAKKSKKLILVEATSKYCYYCIKMDRNVFNKLDIQKKIDKNYIFIKVYVDDYKLPFNLEKYYKHITPSFFILDSNKNLLSSYPGSWSKEDFEIILDELISH